MKPSDVIALPEFRYHPDPVATGCVVPSSDPCSVCGESRGYLYDGPVFAVDEVEDVCPWCIANGRAAELFDAQFTDDGFGIPPDVPAEVVDEIARRTPGFSGWQQEYWLYHCGDGAAYLGRVGRAELATLPDAADSLRASAGGTELFEYLDRDGEANGYLFRCLRCGTHLAYADSA